MVEIKIIAIIAISMINIARMAAAYDIKFPPI
jgi:hypothetical protein